MPVKRALLPLLAAALLSCAAGIYLGTRHHGSEMARQAEAAPLFAQRLPDADGKLHALSQWQGKPLIVNFWATWCGPCVQEMPELSALRPELAAKGIAIIGIGVDSAENIRNFADKYKITYPLYVAGMAGVDLSRRFGNDNGGLPYTVLFDRHGAVVKTYLGRLDIDALRRDLGRLS